MKLHIPRHEIIDKEGKESHIWCAAPTKGIIGTDGRRYIIDLCRASPQDANYKGGNNVMATLRPELVLLLSEEDESKSEGKIFMRLIYLFAVLLNPDVFSGTTLGGTDEQKKIDEDLVENAAAFLLEAIIPNIVLSHCF